MTDFQEVANAEAQVLQVSGFEVLSVVRPLSWWILIYGLVVFSEWKGNSDTGLLDWVLR